MMQQRGQNSSTSLRPGFTPLEQACEIIAGAGLLAVLVLPAIYWPRLPESIPMHFTLEGTPDRYGDRGELVFLVVFLAVFILFFSVMARFMHLMPDTKGLGPEEHVRQLWLARKLIAMLNAEMAVMFAWMIWQTLETAMGAGTGLPGTIMLGFIALIFVTVIAWTVVIIAGRKKA